MRALTKIPLLKIGATTAALLCAGSAALVGPGAAGSPAGAAPALDHYVCVPGLGSDCRGVAVTLPDGTTAAVGDPNARLRCDHVWSWPRRHHQNNGATVTVTNALSPAGTGGPTPVALVERRLRWKCALTTPAPAVATKSGRRASRVAPTTLARFECFTVEYPSRDAVRFTTPSGVQVGDRLRVNVRHPAVLCVPSEPAIAAAAATGGASALVCFETRTRGWRWGPLLCVPSSTGAAPPVGGPGPTTGAGSTSSTSTTTTTTMPATTTGSSTSTTTSTSSTTSTTTTTTMPTTTTTTQPCPGVRINGVCVINL